MASIIYTVVATLPDESTVQRYVAWLKGGHVQAVLAGGAMSVVVAVRDREEGAVGGARVVDVRYVFATRAALERYVREFAPALRAEGVALWGSVAGVRFERWVGEVAET